MLTEPKSYEESAAQALRKRSEKTEPGNRNLSDVYGRIGSRKYDSVKEAVFPYLTCDPYYRDELIAMEKEFRRRGYKGECLIRSWNGFQVGCMAEWQLVYPDVIMPTKVFTADLKKYKITSRTLFNDAAKNLKRWANRTQFHIEKLSDCFLLRCGEELNKNGCSALMLNDLWWGVYSAVEEPYHMLPLLRDLCLVVPEQTADGSEIHQVLNACLEDIYADMDLWPYLLTDTIFFFSPVNKRPVVVPRPVTM